MLDGCCVFVASAEVLPGEKLGGGKGPRQAQFLTLRLRVLHQTCCVLARDPCCVLAAPWGLAVSFFLWRDLPGSDFRSSRGSFNCFLWGGRVPDAETSLCGQAVWMSFREIAATVKTVAEAIINSVTGRTEHFPGTLCCGFRL